MQQLCPFPQGTNRTTHHTPAHTSFLPPVSFKVQKRDMSWLRGAGEMWGSHYSFRTFKESSSFQLYLNTWPPFLLSLHRVPQHDPLLPNCPHQTLCQLYPVCSNTVTFAHTSHWLCSSGKSLSVSLLSCGGSGENADACMSSALFLQTSSEPDAFCI